MLRTDSVKCLDTINRQPIVAKITINIGLRWSNLKRLKETFIFAG